MSPFQLVAAVPGSAAAPPPTPAQIRNPKFLFGVRFVCVRGWVIGFGRIVFQRPGFRWRSVVLQSLSRSRHGKPVKNPFQRFRLRRGAVRDRLHSNSPFGHGRPCLRCLQTPQEIRLLASRIPSIADLQLDVSRRSPSMDELGQSSRAAERLGVRIWLESCIRMLKPGRSRPHPVLIGL